MSIDSNITFDDFFKMIKNNTKLGGQEEVKSKHKKKESKYSFKGPVIEEGDEEDGDISPRRKPMENNEEQENGGINGNGEIKLNGIEKIISNLEDNNGNEKLPTVADSITNNDDK